MIKKIAKKKVPKVVFDYVEGSALDEVSYARSKEAFDQVEFTAHTLRDVSKVDPSIEIFGKKVDLPILFSSLEAWLSHLETAHPVGIDMGLERINLVKAALDLHFDCPVINVAGTNDKADEDILGYRDWETDRKSVV